MTFDSARLPDHLVHAYRERRCAVLVGAGASKGAGLPMWEELLQAMIKEGEGHRVIDVAKATEYRSLLTTSSKFLMIATGLQEDLGPVYFQQFIQRTFIDPKPQPTALHDMLATLDRLQFVLTTNYDTILERKYRQIDADVAVCTFLDVGEIQRRMSRREFFILKAHGDASRIGSGLILTDIDYRRILYRERAYQSLLSSIFTMFTMIFVGASMTDPEVNLLLHYIADSFSPGSGPIHYAAMAEEDVTGVERSRWFKDLNIQLLPISKADNYIELNQLLEALRASV
jgi:hypothetical protein